MRNENYKQEPSGHSRKLQYLKFKKRGGGAWLDLTSD